MARLVLTAADGIGQASVAAVSGDLAPGGMIAYPVESQNSACGFILYQRNARELVWQVYFPSRAGATKLILISRPVQHVFHGDHQWRPLPPVAQGRSAPRRR